MLYSYHRHYHEPYANVVVVVVNIASEKYIYIHIYIHIYVGKKEKKYTNPTKLKNSRSFLVPYKAQNARKEERKREADDMPIFSICKKEDDEKVGKMQMVDK